MRACWRRSELAVIAAMAIALVLAGCGPGPAEAGRGQGTQTGAVRWQLMWSDSFNGPAGSPVSARNWQYITGHSGFGNHQVEANTTSTRNVQLDGQGALDIIVLKQGTTWTSGRIQTRRVFMPPAGERMRVVASLRQPDPDSALGYWPAFWLVGPGEWPQHGEIDILEDVNSGNRHSATFHCGNLSARNPDGTTGPCHEQSGIGTDLLPCPGCQKQFHTYSVIIDRRHPGNESIRWFLDRHQFFSVNERQVGKAAWNEGVHNGYWILLNVALGGDYPNLECGCTTPSAATAPGGTMTVRYVGVFTSS